MGDLINFVVGEMGFQGSENLREPGVVAEFQRAFDAVEIRTEGEALNPGPVPEIQKVADNVLDGGRPAAVAEKLVIEIHADDSAGIRQGAELRVCQVPGMIFQRAAAAVTRDKGLFAVSGNIIEARLGEVRDVDDDAKLVHLLQHVKAEGLQTAARMLRGIGTVRGADAVFIVPGQRNHAHAVGVNRVQAVELSVQLHPVFNGEDGREKAAAGVFQNLASGERGAQDIRAVGEKPSVAVQKLLIELPGLRLPAEIVDRRVMRGNEEGKALGQTAALPQLFQIDMPLPGAEGFIVFVTEQNRVTVQVDDVHETIPFPDQPRSSESAFRAEMETALTVIWKKMLPQMLLQRS